MVTFATANANGTLTERYLCNRKCKWYLDRAARYRSAKPSTAVRVRQVPPKENRPKRVDFFFLEVPGHSFL